ncbi:hypothetical protein H311_00974 [Anncaliia algerae PRA109]|nr:hypothetical protein H311_00974 [Anncaliia algerae PRA109]
MFTYLILSLCAYKNFEEEKDIVERKYLSDETNVNDNSKTQPNEVKLLRSNDDPKRDCVEELMFGGESYSNDVNFRCKTSNEMSDIPAISPTKPKIIGAQFKEIQSYKLKTLQGLIKEHSDMNFYSFRDMYGNIDFRAICDKIKENYFIYYSKINQSIGNIYLLNELKNKVDLHMRYLSSELHGIGVYIETNQWDEHLAKEFLEMEEKFKQLYNSLDLIG